MMEMVLFVFVIKMFITNMPDYKVDSAGHSRFIAVLHFNLWGLQTWLPKLQIYANIIF